MKNIIDIYEYDTDIEDGIFFALIEDEWIESEENTKGERNSPEEIEKDEIKISFSEIFPSPNTGEKEWTEIYNNSSNDLEAKHITFHRDSCDTEKISKDLNSLIFSSESFTIIEEEFFSKKLLNDGGTLLICFKNEVIDELEYPKINKGQAYALNTDEFEVTTYPTPGEENEFEEIEDIEEESEVEEEENDTQSEGEEEIITTFKKTSNSKNDSEILSGILSPFEKFK